MPPAKKQKGVAGAPLSPLDDYFARVEAACAAHNCNGSMIVVGIGEDEEEEEEEEEEEKAERVRSHELACSRPAPRRGRAVRLRLARSAVAQRTKVPRRPPSLGLAAPRCGRRRRHAAPCKPAKLSSVARPP